MGRREMKAIFRGSSGSPAGFVLLIKAADAKGYTEAQTADVLGVSTTQLRVIRHWLSDREEANPNSTQGELHMFKKQSPNRPWSKSKPKRSKAKAAVGVGAVITGATVIAKGIAKRGGK